MRFMLIVVLSTLIPSLAHAGDGPAISWSYRSTDSGSGQGGYADAIQRRGPLGMLANALVKKGALPPACDWSKRSSFTERKELRPRVRTRSNYRVSEQATSCPAEIQLQRPPPQ